MSLFSAGSISLDSAFKKSMTSRHRPHSLIHATIKKIGHNMAVTANDSAQEIIEAARIVQNILDGAKRGQSQACG
jgi:hypothetical protein